MEKPTIVTCSIDTDLLWNSCHLARSWSINIPLDGEADANGQGYTASKRAELEPEPSLGGSKACAFVTMQHQC
jgi:hypothetical protein